MPPEDKDAAYLLDMLEAAQKIQRYVEGKSMQAFEADELLRDAVERNVEIIGEAARRVSAAFKSKHPDIPWRKIIAQRNVLIHEYDSISDDEIWSVATVHAPQLIRTLRPLIPPLPPEPSD